MTHGTAQRLFDLAPNDTEAEDLFDDAWIEIRDGDGLAILHRDAEVIIDRKPFNLRELLAFAVDHARSYIRDGAFQ